MAHLEGANLRFAHLEGADLGLAHLEGANLERADLEGAQLPFARLKGAKMKGVLLGRANLWSAQLHGAALQGANLEGADLRQAVLGEGDDHKGTELESADLRCALFSSARVVPSANVVRVKWGSDRVVYRGSGERVKGWWRRKVSCVWPWKYWHWTEYHLQDERCARNDSEQKDSEWRRTKYRLKLKEDAKPPTFEACAHVYHELRIACQRTSQPERESAFFIREMECKRAHMVEEMVKKQSPLLWWRPGWVLVVLLLLPVATFFGLPYCGWPLAHAWWVPALLAIICVWGWWPMGQRVLMAALYYLCGYGEKPQWVAGWALGVVVVLGWVQGLLGVREGNEYTVGPGLEWPTWAGGGRLLTALYFSVVTFVTLGYGDVRSAPVWGRLVAGGEAVVGFVLLSLFMICLVRKFSR